MTVKWLAGSGITLAALAGGSSCDDERRFAFRNRNSD